MKEEDKELLLKDLCARLPYGVKVKVTQVPIGLSKNEILTYNRMYSLDESDEYITIKPYLRSMSSMTEEEMFKLDAILSFKDRKFINIAGTPQAYDWLYENHLDFRNLIERGLALEAPKGMYE